MRREASQELTFHQQAGGDTESLLPHSVMVVLPFLPEKDPGPAEFPSHPASRLVSKEILHVLSFQAVPAALAHTCPVKH